MGSYKISELEILYENQPKISLENIGSGLNVVFGSNESGKSRIKEFIEWMIFAQSPQFQALSPQAKKSSFQSANQILKGSLTIKNGFELATITQQISGNSTVATLSNNSKSLDDIIHLLSDDLSLAHFRNVFSLNLDALSREKSNYLLSEDKTAEVFLSAAQTGSGVSLSALVADLKNKKEELFSESGNATKRQINRLLKEISDIDKEIRQIRREQQTSLSFTSDIESLQQEHFDLKIKLNEISDELVNLNLTKTYAQSFERYGKLNQSDNLDFDIDLIGEIVNVRELLIQCEHHEGDEKLLNQLLIEKSEIFDLLERNKENLAKTLDPENVATDIYSHSFKTALELEKQASSQFSQDRARAQESFDKENDELVLLTNRVDDLTKQIDSLSENSSTTKMEQKTPTSGHSKSKTYKNLMSATALLAGLAVAGISIFTGQLIGAISGIILIAFGVSVRLIKSNELVAPQTEQSGTIESIQISNIQREIDGLYSQIKHKETQIAKHVDTLENLEKQRSKAKQEFINKISEFGFNRDLDPIHIELYINDLEKFQSQEKQLRDIESRANALSEWFDNFFDSIATLQVKLQNTKCALNDQITTISHARTWLESVLEFALENKELEKQLHERDSEIRTLEKSLVTQFSSIENAKEHFKRFEPQEIDEKIIACSTNRKNLGERLSELDQEIGSIRKMAEHAGQETQLQDQLLLRESLVRELEEAHLKYSISFSANKVAEAAFSHCQRESQPEVLLKASNFLSKSTNGKWTHISINLTDNGRSKMREVDMTVSNDSETLDVLKLSQGTQEQLYLSLRLALMESSPRGKQIPALFDDIAVNSDKSRFASIAPLIWETAQTRQVFYFTCHEWVRDELEKFENVKVLNIS